MSSYLAHHGIKGQEWGVRNGPPYPLDAGDHSSSERRAGWRESLDRSGGGHRNNKISYGIDEAMAIRLSATGAIFAAIGIKALIDNGKAKVASKKEELRRETLHVDEKTGLRIKDKEWTPEEDMKVINPAYKNFNSNTKNNCMLCTTAYELRRRGYDVHAGLTKTGYTDDVLFKWFPKVKMEHVYKAPTDSKQLAKEGVKASYGLNGGKEKYERLSQMVSKYGDGARGNLLLTWSGGCGHSVVWENKNGKVIIRDCQSNRTYSSIREIKNILGTTIGVHLIRTDNAAINYEEVKKYLG